MVKTKAKLLSDGERRGLIYNEYCSFYLERRDAGMSREKAFTALKRIGYSYSLKTLYRHLKRFKETQSALPNREERRLPPQNKSLLSDNDKEVLNDFVLSMNEQNKPICLDDIRNFILAKFGLDVTRASACRYLQELGMSNKTCMTKTAGHKDSLEVLVDMYWKFILMMRASPRHAFVLDPALIRSIDCTYTSKPKRTVTTYSKRGGGKQRSAKKVVSYTDGIITMCSADGVNSTPCWVFTHNPRFNPHQANTVRGKAILEDVESKCALYGIHRSRIIYLPGVGKYYVGEKPEMYERFLEHYASLDRGRTLPRSSLILHDGGNAFKRGGQSIFPMLGFHNHETYPALVHQFLSPNDNKLHGVKATWAKGYYKFEEGDSISPTLYLMQLLDKATPNCKQYFDDNLLKVKLSEVEHIIKD